MCENFWCGPNRHWTTTFAGVEKFTGAGIPHPGGVVAARTDQTFSVVAEVHGVDAVLMSFEAVESLPGGDVNKQDRVVHTRDRRRSPPWIECHVGDSPVAEMGITPGVLFELADLLLCVKIPQYGRSCIRAGEQHTTTGPDLHRRDGTGVTAFGQQRPATPRGVKIPDYRQVLYGDDKAAGANVDGADR